MEQNAPWWVCMVFSVFLLQHHHRLTLDVDHPAHLARRLQQVDPSDVNPTDDLLNVIARRLQEIAPNGDLLYIFGRSLQEVDPTDDLPNATNPIDDNETIVLPIPCIYNFIKPCGNVTLPEEGINISLPFGTYHVDGGGELQPEIEAMDRAFSKYTVYFCMAAVCVWVVATVSIKSKRETFVKSVMRTLEGNLDDELQEGEPKVVEDINPESDNFIAPGNIYRVLAVCPPGETPGVSLSRWLMWSCKAFLCAYMQIYLPCGFLKDIFSEWQFDSIKSPVWFVANIGSFATMFASLAAICSLFASKCDENISRGAKANFYILTHEEHKKVADIEAGATAAANATEAALDSSVKKPADIEAGATAAANATEAALDSSVKKPLLDAKAKALEAKAAFDAALAKKQEMVRRRVIAINDYFWCTLSMIMNISMSMLLQFVMFLKVATFTGTTESVAVVTLSLYFVIELDKKIMDSDPKLNRMYRARVIARDQARKIEPVWLKKIASVSMGLLNSSVSLGLYAIILFAWKNRSTGFTIGGDPITH